MGEPERDEVRDRLETYVGKPIGRPTVAPDPVNVPMIRHWVAALDDRNPIYLDEAFAGSTRHGGIVAPPAMLQTWTMPSPKIEGIAERGGSPVEIDADNVIRALDREGFTGTLATNSELEFVRYLRPGDRPDARDREELDPRRLPGHARAVVRQHVAEQLGARDHAGAEGVQRDAWEEAVRDRIEGDDVVR